MNQPHLMTSAEVASRLKIDRSLITRYVKAGQLTPALKLPGIRGAYLFDRSAVEQLKADREAS